MKVAIDADSLIYAANANMEKKGQSLAEAFGWIEMRIDNIKTQFELEFNEVVDVCKVVLSSQLNFRKEIDAEYKANRPAKPQGVKDLYKMLHESALNIECKKGFEADDIVVWLRNYFDYEVASPDKDVKRQLSSCFDYQKNVFVGINTDEDIEFNIWTQCLEGDRDDNIKGVMGYGPKFAKQTLMDFGYDVTLMTELFESFEEFEKTMRLIRLDQMDKDGNLILWKAEESPYVTY